MAWNNGGVVEKKNISNVLSTRYASPDMAEIWSPEHKIILERQLWIAVMKAQKDLGVDIPAEAIAAYEAAVEHVDLDSIAQRVRHAVDQGNLGPHHDKIRGDVHREFRHPRGISHLGVLRMHGGHLRVRRGAGSDVQVGHGGVCFQAGEQGVFAAARADNEDTHAVHLNGR